MQELRFSYPGDDDEIYLSWYRKEFSSVFIATNPFLRVLDFPWTSPMDFVSEEVLECAKRQGEQSAVTWRAIAEMCEFTSIAQVNRALRLTGSKRIMDELAKPQDTDLMLEKCAAQNIFLPDEGRFSPSAELSIGRFLEKLGHNKIIAASSFGHAPWKMAAAQFSNLDSVAAAEVQAIDGSMYISIYTDFPYILVCQTDESRSVANPEDFFEGFFADDTTCDLWGVGDLANSTKV